MALVTALLVRYFRSMASPLLLREVVAARALSRRGFNVPLDQIGKRLGTYGRLTAEIVESLGQADQERATTMFDR
jgi:hypothetical protein